MSVIGSIPLVGDNIISGVVVPFVKDRAADKTLMLIDEQVDSLYGETLAALKAIVPPARRMILAVSEESKSLERASDIWQWLATREAGRRSLLINVGGGALTDLGGFAASIFKRGIPTINIPTTLMGMVDASLGGKTGVNRAGLKNELGTFHLPIQVFADTAFLSGLPERELLSGYTEMLKHALLSGEQMWHKVLSVDPLKESEMRISLIRESMMFKMGIVEQDPEEGGLRRILNLGHTVGHAIESLSMADPELPNLTHGESILIGLIAELYICHRRLCFPASYITDLVNYARGHYAAYPVQCKQYDRLLAFARCDKKNVGRTIYIVGLRKPGDYLLDLPVEEADLLEGLDFYRETFGK